MAALPPLAQIVGSHGAVYEAYFKQADFNSTGSVGALDAANFMKKSGLQQKVLSQIWDLADSSGRGYLDYPSFCVALKLIALAQSGQDTTHANLTSQAPVPKLGEVSTAPPPGGQVPWTITLTEKSKYDQIFESLQPTNNKLAGDKVKPVLLNSKLPTDVLGRVWDLSDIDKDGSLDRDEFAVAMHLVYRALEKEPVPSSLPSALVPPSKRKKAPSLPGAVSVLPVPAVSAGATLGGAAVTSVSSSMPLTPPSWVVTPGDLVKYEVAFKTADTDNDGLITGGEVRDIFMQSGLPQPLLAHIWTLCDISGTGKLNLEQFALAMWLLHRKLGGNELPQTLPPEMVPPSLRPEGGLQDVTPVGEDFPGNKELDVISQEIEEIKREKISLEKERVQKEADVKIRNGEVAALQKELDAINSTIQQLENQKGEAQKRLDELDDKKSQLQITVKELKEKCEDEQKQVDNLKGQITNQEKSIQDQETKLEEMKCELGSLKTEESKLEEQVETGRTQLETLAKSIKDTQIQISQTKAKVQHLQDTQRSLHQSIAQYQGLLNGDSNASEPVPVGDASDLFSTQATFGSTSPISTLSEFSTGSEDPFKNKDPFSTSQDGSSDPFQGDDPFKSAAADDPFKGTDPFKSNSFGTDPFGGSDPFKDAFGTTTSSQSNDDPFKGSDPFVQAFHTGGSTGSAPAASNDPFDPFGGGSLFDSNPSITVNKPLTSADPFGGDPFAPTRAASAPPVRPNQQSPTPALPPKQKKTVPPRPAPPRPQKSPVVERKSPSAPDQFAVFESDPFGSSDPFSSTTPSSNDPFAVGGSSDPFGSALSGVGSGGSGGGSDPFANFADFSPSKFGVSEDDQLEWAKKEGRKLEIERQKKLEQEKADLEMAIALSKAESQA